MHAQLESEGYANVMDVIVKWLHGREVNTPALNTFVTSAGQHHDTFDILWRLDHHVLSVQQHDSGECDQSQ